MTLTKKCSRCETEYPATPDYFHRYKDGKDGLRNICKECRTRDKRERYKINGDRDREYGQRYYREHKEECLERSRQYRKQHPEERRLEAQRYRERQGNALRERERDRMRRWRKENPEKYHEINRQYYQLNREKILEQGLIRCRENPEKTREIQRKSSRRYKEQHKDKLREYRLRPDVRLHQAISAGIWKSLDGRKNGRAWESLVGYTCEDLMVHLESQFTRGMTWENYGEWHIDHIKPKSCFNIESHRDPDFLECWSFWNLRPLWKRDNIVRGNRVEEVPLPLLPPSPE